MLHFSWYQLYLFNSTLLSNNSSIASRLMFGGTVDPCKYIISQCQTSRPQADFKGESKMYVLNKLHLLSNQVTPNREVHTCICSLSGIYMSFYGLLMSSNCIELWKLPPVVRFLLYMTQAFLMDVVRLRICLLSRSAIACPSENRTGTLYP